MVMIVGANLKYDFNIWVKCLDLLLIEIIFCFKSKFMNAMVQFTFF